MKAGGLSETSARTFTTTCRSRIQKTRIRIQALSELRNVQEISAQGEFGPSQISVHMWSNVCGYTSKPIRSPTSNTLQTDRKQLDCLPPLFRSSSILPPPNLSHCAFILASKNSSPFTTMSFLYFVYFLNSLSLKVRNFK
jgi:hypothetical protein